METPETQTTAKAKAPRLKRYQIYKGEELELNTDSFKKVIDTVNALRAAKTKEFTIVDSKDNTKQTQELPRYSRNYRVTGLV